MRRATVTTSALTATLILLAALVGAVVPTQVAQAAAPPGNLPWDMPARSVLTAGKPVFAQYFVPHPISLDNKPADVDFYTTEMIAPDGQDGKWADRGGALRDRPLPRLVLPGTKEQWYMEDLKTEVRQAMAAGLDGFAVGVLNPKGHWNYTHAAMMIDAAEAVDPSFKIVITPDMAGKVGDLTSAGLAQMLADLTGTTASGTWKLRPSMYRLDDGRVLLHPFPTQKRSLTFWTEVLAKYQSLTGKELALWAGFHDVKPQHGAYNSITDGIAAWGEANLSRNQEGPTGVAENAAYAHDRGKAWMQQVHPFDQRPIQHQATSDNGYFDEPRGTETLKRQWEGAINGGADAVQLITWNDYAETALAPSAGHGWGPLDISSYYLVKFKTGAYPTIKRDAVYLTHRHQLSNATPKCASYVSPRVRCTLPMLIRDNTNPVENIVEAQTFLTAPATVTLKVGSQTTIYDAPAGRFINRVPLAVGTVSVSVARSGDTVAQVTSPYKVLSSPEVQDMQYHMVSSLRDGDGDTTAPPAPGDTTAPAAPASLNASVSGQQVTLTWPEAVDETAMYGYEVHRGSTAAFTPGSSTKLATITGTSYVDAGRPAGTWFYKVRSVDLAGNTSAQAASASVTVSGAPAQTSPVTVVTSADTYVNETEPTTKYGSDPSVGSYGTPEVLSYLRFALPRAPAGQELQSAVLRVTTTDVGGAGSANEQLVYSASNTWTESTVTYDTRPSIGELPIGSLRAGTAPSTTYDIQIDPEALSDKLGTSSTLAITGTGSDSTWLVAQESGVDKPATLHLQFSGTSTSVTPPPAGATEVEVLASADTYVNATQPTTIRGTSTSLAAYGSPDVMSFIRYAIPEAPAGKALKQATLTLHTTGIASAGSEHGVEVNLASGSWSEATTTYNNRPSVGAQIGFVPQGPDQGESYTLPLDSAAISTKAGSSVTLAVSGTGTDGLWFRSRQSVLGGPILTLSYS